MSARRVLVVGGSGTVGSAICAILGREGCKVALTYHSRREAAERVAREIPGASVHPCDLRDFASVRGTVEAAAGAQGGLDALVVAAGVPCFESLEEITADRFEEVVAVNTRGAIAACQAAAPFLKEGGGNIVLIGTLDGIKAVPSPAHFAASKSALRGVVASLAKELGPSRVKVNVVAPGLLEGGSSAKVRDEIRQTYLKHCSLKRFGRPQEIAELVGWLAVENTYITGQSIVLDGGL